MFNDQLKYPKNWKEMSLDMRMMFAYHVSMMVLMVGGGSLSVRQELALAAGIAAVIASVSRYHRLKRHWRWPGIRLLDVVYAIGGIILISFFLYSATPLAPPTDSHIVPWYLAGLGIGLFGVLQTLEVVYSSEVEFASHCMIVDQYGREIEPPAEPPMFKESEPTWKRIAKFAYTVAFMMVWVAGVAFFYFSGTAIKNASSEPTAKQSEPLEDHGKTVYVTPAEKQRIHTLQLFSWIGFPVVLLSGAALHFLVGVKLFPNTPTLSEYISKNRKLPKSSSV